MTDCIGLVAGEPSGDLIAAQVLTGMKEARPQLVASGIGGPALQASGMQIWHPMDMLSVFGYVDALKNLPRIYAIFKDVQRRWLANPPEVFVGVDAPDFNLRLEHNLKKRGIPTVHFVSPSIWAWRYERIHRIRQAVSHMLVLFPFELEIYEREGIPATYVGHPLADKIALEPDRQATREALGIDPDATVIAILPGSRRSEIELMTPKFLAAAERLQQRAPGLIFVVPMVNQARKAQFEQMAANFKLANLQVIETSSSEQWPASWRAMAACNMALVTSGTATLECALFKRPMVISYVLSPWMRRIMAWKSGQSKPNLPWVGLPNVLSQSFVVPELLQDEATPENLANALWGLWEDAGRRHEIEQQFVRLHQTLRCDTATRASQAILQVMERGP
ncbi:lipid-A-disaccharide synthase [Orrella daihaiensis]|uniref:Lipid-A-disaccharide synthase n=1 Tax=Orrella daihaiensis TaxID=2782176 RepID=A0ABY4AGI2_9BURK|nr:lipid-A-disaccharide synthase [Orrella daihaiensis]UOD49362.1 lipid-A-disaccharide synthase [Orrella daihaiensis]